MLHHEIDFEPVGRRVTVPAGQTLLDAAQTAGVALMAVCGGAGLCLECRVRLMQGELTAHTTVEIETFTQHELDSGMRLACQAQPLSSVKIEIPPESLTTPQRLQVEGREDKIPVEPQVIPEDFTLTPPSLVDLRDDVSRLKTAVAEKSMMLSTPGLGELLQFSERIRMQNWQGRLALRRSDRQASLCSTLPTGTPIFGLAVDIGTTKLAAYLVNLETDETVGKLGAMNPQIAYGEDVVSRIGYANQGDDHRRTLQTRLVETLNDLVSELCAAADVKREQVVDAVLVGNTAMHHLFAGLSVRQLGQAPYVAAVTDALDFPARQVGLNLAPGAFVHLPPNIAGYVGADHVAMLLASGVGQTPKTALALDIGTNTEICLSANGRLLSCSCASGPAFEGAHISAGMRAAPGAIERVQLIQKKLRISTIDGKPPVGICGSGILDVVAEMYAAKVIDARGVLQKGALGVRAGERGGAFLLVPAEETGNGTEILVTRRDVNEIQLAKAAIRAGIEILLLEAGLHAEDIDHFIVAGAFGTYLYLPSALHIGMFPRLPHERFEQVGNAAGIGARQMLISMAKRKEAQDILQKMEYIELTTHPAFADTFVEAISLDF